MSRNIAILILMILSLSQGACGKNGHTEVGDIIDRDTFIKVYVDLRSVALRKTSLMINAVERDSILSLNNVTEEDLRSFLDFYNSESEFMRDLWNDADARISLMIQTADKDDSFLN